MKAVKLQPSFVKNYSDMPLLTQCQYVIDLPLKRIPETNFTFTLPNTSDDIVSCMFSGFGTSDSTCKIQPVIITPFKRIDTLTLSSGDFQIRLNGVLLCARLLSFLYQYSHPNIKYLYIDVLAHSVLTFDEITKVSEKFNQGVDFI